MGDVRRAELPAFDIPKFLDESEAFTREDAAAPLMVKAVSLGRPKMVRLPNGSWVRPEAVTRVVPHVPRSREDGYTWRDKAGQLRTDVPKFAAVHLSGAGEAANICYVDMPEGGDLAEFVDEVARLINGE